VTRIVTASWLNVEGMSQAGAGANHDEAQNQTPKVVTVIVNKMCENTSISPAN